jgi:CheY-like chemotaxis protein
VEDRSQEQRKHIFAINGAPDFLNLIRDLFQDEGYNVTTTNFVPNSFEQIAALHPDALIVDIVVGQRADGNCWSRFNAEAATTGIPVLIVSTDPRLLERAREQAARYGENRYLIKPFAWTTSSSRSGRWSGRRDGARRAWPGPCDGRGTAPPPRPEVLPCPYGTKPLLRDPTIRLTSSGTT